MFNTRIIAAAIALSAIAAVPAMADQGYTISDTGNDGFGSYNLGYEFSVANPITVTDLGYYVGSFDGAASHDAGLYASDGTLLASTTVNSSDTQVGSFLYHEITPVTLSAGTYVVNGPDTGSGYKFGLHNFTAGAGITILQDRYNGDSALSFANHTESSSNPLNYTGANIQYNGAVVTPEPGQFAILGIGVFSLAALAFKARRNNMQLS